MHDFRDLPHVQPTLNLCEETVKNSLTLANGRSTILVMEPSQPLDDPQIPDWYQSPITPYKIALIGLLEAQGIKIYSAGDAPWLNEDALDYRHPTNCQCKWEDGARAIMFRQHGCELKLYTLYRRAIDTGFCSWCDIPF